MSSALALTSHARRRGVGAVHAAGAVHAKTFTYANQGDTLSMDPHMLNETLLLNFTGNVYEALVGRGKKLELEPELATDWKRTAPDRLALQPAQGREVPRRQPVHRGRRDLLLRAGARRGLGHEDLRRADQGDPQGRQPHDRHRHHRAVSDPARRADAVAHHVQELVREEQRRAPGGRAQGHGELRQHSRQRHRAVPAASRASPACARCWSSTPAGGASPSTTSPRRSSCPSPTKPRAWPR